MHFASRPVPRILSQVTLPLTNLPLINLLLLLKFLSVIVSDDYMCASNSILKQSFSNFQRCRVNIVLSVFDKDGGINLV